MQAEVTAEKHVYVFIIYVKMKENFEQDEPRFEKNDRLLPDGNLEARMFITFQFQIGNRSMLIPLTSWAGLGWAGLPL